VRTDPSDAAADRAVGLSPRRERIWGWVGGLLGSLVGIGSAVVAWRFDGASLRELSGSPYPPVFARRGMLALDWYFLGVLLLGMAFLATAIVGVRLGRYPRTDGFGAMLIGTVLCSLVGVVLFLRLWAVLHG
jgi:hypothetical protein